MLASLGIGRLPLMLAANAKAAGRLVPVLPDWTLPGAVVYAVNPENRDLSPKVAPSLIWRSRPFPNRPRAATASWLPATPPRVDAQRTGRVAGSASSRGRATRTSAKSFRKHGSTA